MKYFPHALLVGYVALFAACAVSPYDRATWWAENIPIIAIVVVVVGLSPWVRFSNPAYAALKAEMHALCVQFAHETGDPYFDP